MPTVHDYTVRIVDYLRDHPGTHGPELVKATHMRHRQAAIAIRKLEVEQIIFYVKGSGWHLS